MQPTLLEQGLSLMAVGMGTVFVFLTGLIVATTIMSRLLQRFGGGEPPPGAGPRPDDRQLVAVITAAIREHRRR